MVRMSNVKSITLYRDITLKNGIILKKGTKGQISPLRDQNGKVSTIGCNLYLDGYDRVMKLSYTSVCKQPSVTSLMRWAEDGIAKSVGGKRVEPDGYDPDGFPSWLLVVGMI